MSVAERMDEESPSQPGKRVLVAEDSPVTQDLLKLVLDQRGHTVDVVHDGEQALRALRQGAYDVALLDFRIPKTDGLQVAAAVRRQLAGKGRPRLVAITADVEGLLGHEENCENFDLIVHKPLDIHEICNVIEEDFEPESAQAGPSFSRGGERPPASSALRETQEQAETPRRRHAPSAVFGLGYEFLSWPDDLDAGTLSSRAMKATTGEAAFDAVLVQEAAGFQDLAVLWRRKQLHVLPVIDLAGALGPCADLDASNLSYGETEAVSQLIETFHERRAGLHRDFLVTNEPGEKLLARLLLTGGELKAWYAPDEPGAFCYNMVLDVETAVREAEQQRRAGFLNAVFFDRFHVCARCGSARFNVREECSKCRSPDLSEEQYLHHYKCAYQGPESDFRQDDDLVCPKCRQELAHFSVDYDKPGSLILCRSCGHGESEAAVGFLCLDCGAHSDAEAVSQRDAYNYHLTDQARAFLETGRAFLGPAQQTLRFSELPLNLVVALNEQARRYNEEGIPFSLLDISYRNERGIVREHGYRQFARARDLFLENLRHVLRKEDEVVKGHAFDFALIKGVDPGETRQGLEHIRQEALEGLRTDPGVVIQVFGPKDFA